MINAEPRPSSTPPPLPPEALRGSRKLRPPATPIDALAVKDGAKTFESQHVIEAFEVPGFAGLTVCATLEKKQGRTETEPNEDMVFADPDTGLLGVADGLGGEGYGAQASRAAARLLPKFFKTETARAHQMPSTEVVHGLKEYFGHRFEFMATEERRRRELQVEEMANNAVLVDPVMAERALALLKSVTATNELVRETKGKTTVCTGFVHTAPDGQRYAVVANLGDSAGFKRRSNGELIALTEEDSLLSQLIEQGFITKQQVEELRMHPDQTVTLGTTTFTYAELKRSMGSALGGKETPYASLSIRRLDPGDELLLVTDGITDVFEDETRGETDLHAMSTEVIAAPTPKARLNELREAAASRTSSYKVSDDKAAVSARVN